MSVQLVNPPFAVEAACGVCGGLFAVSVLVAIYAMLTILERTKALVPQEGDKDLKPSVRKAREFDRVWRGLMAPEVKCLRQLMFGAYLMAFSCGGIILLLTVMFGERVSTLP